MLDERPKSLHIYLYLTMFVSSYVLIEPSPYDLLMIILIIYCFIFALYVVSNETIIPYLVVTLFLISNLVSLFFVKEIFTAVRYSGITFYLVASWVCLIGLGHHYKLYLLQIISRGYLVSAALAVLIGIAAYFNVIPASEEFLLFGRVKSTFKDPNVFGPFLIFPALYTISLMEMKEMKRVHKVISFLLFLLLSAGIILSYSRAAWGNFALSLFLYIVIVKKEFIISRIKSVLLIVIIGIPCIIYFVQTPIVEDLLASRLMIKDYDSERFGTQRVAVEVGMLNPFGIGPGHSESAFQYSPHSLYARVFTENGLIGFVSFVTLLLLSMYKSFESYWKSTGEYSVLFIVIFASICGLVFNSFFIDTLHWRHLWIILALAYFPVFNDEIQSKQNKSLGKDGVL